MARRKRSNPKKMALGGPATVYEQPGVEPYCAYPRDTWYETNYVTCNMEEADWDASPPIPGRCNCKCEYHGLPPGFPNPTMFWGELTSWVGDIPGAPYQNCNASNNCVGYCEHYCGNIHEECPDGIDGNSPPMGRDSGRQVRPRTSARNRIAYNKGGRVNNRFSGRTQTNPKGKPKK